MCHKRSAISVSIEIRFLQPGDESALANVAPEVFDHPIHARATIAFLADPRHHIVVAIENGVVVGFASGVHYFHPDKPVPELWINELGVAPTHRGGGVGTSLLEGLLQKARELGCAEAWVLTDRDNLAAMRLYASSGGVEARPDPVMFTFSLEEQR
jgi:GNAT superfamily N-acetyltransferase